MSRTVQGLRRRRRHTSVGHWLRRKKSPSGCGNRPRLAPGTSSPPAPVSGLHDAGRSFVAAHHRFGGQRGRHRRIEPGRGLRERHRRGRRRVAAAAPAAREDPADLLQPDRRDVPDLRPTRWAASPAVKQLRRDCRRQRADLGVLGLHHLPQPCIGSAKPLLGTRARGRIRHK